MARRSISKYTKETLQFFGQPIAFLLQQQIALLLIAVAVTEIAFASSSYGLPAYLEKIPREAGLTLGIELALITSTYFILSLTTASFFGSFSDRLGRRPFLILGTAIAGISFIPFPFLFPVYVELPFSFVILALANGLKGLAAAMISGPVLAVFADLSPEENHGETMGKFYLAKSAGGAIGFVIGIITWAIFEVTAYFAFAIIMFIATSIYLFRFFEPHSNEESELIVTDLARAEDADIETNPFKTMIESLQDKQFRKFAIAWLCYTTLTGAGVFVIPIIINDLVEELGLIIAIIGFIGLSIIGIMQPVLGKLSDDIGRKPFLIIGVVGTSMLLMMLAAILKSLEEGSEILSDLIRDPFSITKTKTLGIVPEVPIPIPHLIIVIMLFILILSASSFASAALGLISDVTKSEHRGREMGLTQSLMATGSIIGANVGGFFIGVGGVLAVVTFCFTLSLIAIIIIIHYLYETSGFYHFTHKLV